MAESYDRDRFHGIGGRYKNHRLRRLLTRVLKSLPSGSSVLDVPCGTGRIDNWVLEAPLGLIAADISSEMLEVAKRKVRAGGRRPGFLRADARQLPFRARSVDAVLSIRFLHLLDRQARLGVLRELARIARRWVVVEYRVERPMKKAKRAVIRWFTGGTGRRKMGVAEITAELRRCGLVVEHAYFISRWFSGSVLVWARCPAPVPPGRDGHARSVSDAEPVDGDGAWVTSGQTAPTKAPGGGGSALPT